MNEWMNVKRMNDTDFQHATPQDPPPQFGEELSFLLKSMLGYFVFVAILDVDN